MAIDVRCRCGKKLRAKNEHAGKRTACPACGKLIVIGGDRVPDNDVFISYSSKDKQVADAVCAQLEESRIRCWIAPRDATPGPDYAESIINALNESRIMVLVFSSNANHSAHVLHEVERAVNKGLVIVPFRIEEVLPTGGLELHISAAHWLDAISPPLRRHLASLATTIQKLLSNRDSIPINRLQERRRRGRGWAVLRVTITIALLGTLVSLVWKVWSVVSLYNTDALATEFASAGEQAKVLLNPREFPEGVHEAAVIGTLASGDPLALQTTVDAIKNDSIFATSAIVQSVCKLPNPAQRGPVLHALAKWLPRLDPQSTSLLILTLIRDRYRPAYTTLAVALPQCRTFVQETAKFNSINWADVYTDSPELAETILIRLAQPLPNYYSSDIDIFALPAIQRGSTRMRSLVLDAVEDYSKHVVHSTHAKTLDLHLGYRPPSRTRAIDDSVILKLVGILAKHADDESTKRLGAIYLEIRHVESQGQGYEAGYAGMDPPPKAATEFSAALFNALTSLGWSLEDNSKLLDNDDARNRSRRKRPRLPIGP